MNNSSTPRTDAFLAEHPDGFGMAPFCRQLEREVAELREAAQAIVTDYFDGDFRPSNRERLICVLRDLLRKCRPMVARSMMSGYRDAAPDEKPDAVLRAIDAAIGTEGHAQDSAETK